MDIQRNRCATIVEPDVRTAREVLAARRLIEGELIREATLAATKSALDALRQCVDDERNEDRRQMLVAACGCPVIFIFSYLNCLTIAP